MGAGQFASMDESTSISRTATLAGFTAAVATAHGVHLRDLAPMTTLHVHTRNSLYRIIVSAGDAVLVEGGEFFPNLTPAHFSGASVGAHFISGPNGCSTKPIVNADGSHNSGPVDESCGGETTVPEPATMMLLATGLVGLGGATFVRRRKENKGA